MTDEPQPTPEERLREQAKRDLETPPEPVPGAERLPADVADGRVEDDGSTVDHHEGD